MSTRIKNWNTQVEGVDVDYAAIRSLYPEAGRFFNPDEVKSRDKVALLGPTVARELLVKEIRWGRQ